MENNHRCKRKKKNERGTFVRSIDRSIDQPTSDFIECRNSKRGRKKTKQRTQTQKEDGKEKRHKQGRNEKEL